MAESSFPVADGAGVTEATYERLMGPVMGSGRYAFNPTTAQLTTPLIYADSSGRQVKAYANQSAVVRGFRWESGTTPPVVALDANTSGNPRLDLIVLRLNRSTWTVRLTKITGMPAATPVAPAPIQEESSVGSWDLPLARVRVTSSGVSGQPIIAAADVTGMDWWVTPPGVTAKSGTVIPPTAHGQLFSQPDTNRTYRATGTSWTLFGDRTAHTKVSPAAGWGSDNIYVRRVNGFAFFQCAVNWTGPAQPANKDLTICTLPSTFRPASDGTSISGVAFMAPGQSGWAQVSTAGVVTIYAYPQQLNTGGLVVVHPMTWPVTN